MKRTILSCLALSAFATLQVIGQQPFDTLTSAPSHVEGQTPPAQPPQPPKQVDTVGLRIAGPGGGPPKLAVTQFLALSPDAETVAAAKTIGDVLYDDIAY